MLRKSFWAQIKSKLWRNHFWSPSYCVVSAGGASLDLVKNCTKNHHKPPSEKTNQSKKSSLKAEGVKEPPLKETGLRKPSFQSHFL